MSRLARPETQRNAFVRFKLQMRPQKINPTRKGPYIHSLKLTAKAPENRPFARKGNNLIPTIHFQVLLLLVSGRTFFCCGSSGDKMTTIRRFTLPERCLGCRCMRLHKDKGYIVLVFESDWLTYLVKRGMVYI